MATVMTQFERLHTLSTVACCVCDRSLSLRELDEFYSTTDEQFHSEAYCYACKENHLVLCRECSRNYTAGDICGACSASLYALAG